MILPSPELGLTSPFRREGYQRYADRKLGTDDNPKPDRDGSVFHGHGVYPAIIFRNPLRVV